MRSLLLLLTFCLATTMQAQEKETAAIKEAAAKAEIGWKKGGSIGFNLSGLGLFNPRVGAGGSNFGIGGLGTIFSNYKGTKTFWTNDLNLQLAAQRVQVPGTTRRDFIKNLDVIRLNSRIGYSLKGDKLFAALDAMAQTFLLPTYPGNTLQPVKQGDDAIAAFFNPLILTIAPGIAYNPNAHWTFFYSPASVRYILVADNAIAQLNIHGNEKDANTFLGLGSELKIGYTNKYYKDKVAVTSKLGLFSNYLNGPGNIDVLWNNGIDIEIFKGLSLGLLGELFYDNDMQVQVDRNDNGIFGETLKSTPTLTVRDELAPAASLTGAFVLKYSRIF